MDGRTRNLTLTDLSVWWLKVAAVAAAWHSLAHLAQPGTVLLLAWQWGCHPHQSITGITSISPPISVCCWLCIWGLPGLPSSPDTGEGARAELSHATCPGQRPQQGEADPALPSPKAIKNEAHSAAHLGSDQITARQRAAMPSFTAGAGNATCTAQHPHASHTHTPQKSTGKLGGRKRLHPVPYLPVQRCSHKGNSEGKRQLPGESRSGCFALRPDRSRIQWWYGRADSGEGKRSYRLCKDTNKRH